LLSANSTIIL